MPGRLISQNDKGICFNVMVLQPELISDAFKKSKFKYFFATENFHAFFKNLSILALIWQLKEDNYRESTKSNSLYLTKMLKCKIMQKYQQFCQRFNKMETKNSGYFWHFHPLFLEHSSSLKYIDNFCNFYRFKKNYSHPY